MRSAEKKNLNIIILFYDISLNLGFIWIKKKPLPSPSYKLKKGKFPNIKYIREAIKLKFHIYN
jgi:hypothetical protein